MHQIVDSQPTRDIHTSGRAKAPAERELYSQRCELLDELRRAIPDTAIHTSQVKRHRNEEADLLTKHVVLAPTSDGHQIDAVALAKLHRLFLIRFRQPMQLYCESTHRQMPERALLQSCADTRTV